jgi:hypothetical protein
MTSDNPLWAFMIILLVLIVCLCLIRILDTAEQKETQKLLHQQGFIQVIFHDTTVWIKSQDAQSLVQTDLEIQNGH